MTAHTKYLRERIAQAERDLLEIQEQVAAGDLDQETASALIERYKEERSGLLAEVAEAAKAADTADDGETAEQEGALSGRKILAIGLPMTVVIAVLLFIVSNNTSSTSGVEGVAEDVVTGEAESLDSVSNEEMEAVIAQNPDIPGMRLALADRYFFEGDYTNALAHYLYVLEDLGVSDPEALANVGWMTYQSGFPDLAVSFVEESLDVQPAGGIAFWYLANIYFYGLDDPAAAAIPLRGLLAIEGLPDALRQEAERLMTEIEAEL